METYSFGRSAGMTYQALYPPTVLLNRRPLLKPISTFLMPVSIEFHSKLASLGIRLWQMVPKDQNKRNEEAWNLTLIDVRRKIEDRLSEYGYTSCRWDEKFDRTFITPMRDGKPIQIKKKHNLEHYLEEQANLEKFRAEMEGFLTKGIPLIYASHLPSK